MSIVGDLDELWRSSPLAAALYAIATLDWRRGAGHPGGPVDRLEFGRCDGASSQLERLPDGRSIRLLAELAYAGADGVRWSVPTGTELEGASIPRPLWSLIGDPFEGPYRNASILHDHHCAVRDRDWRSTHRMLHDAMRYGGLPRAKAKIIFYLIYRFGPRWPCVSETRSIAGRLESLSQAAARTLVYDAEAIHRHDLSLREIEELADMREAEAAAPPSPELEAPAGRVDVATLAGLISVPGGGGTAEDVTLVAARAALLPRVVLERFSKNGVRIVACRGSVTDFERDLRGVVPRGWESTGKTWDDVPGAYLPARHRVVVATVASGAGRAIPGKGAGHGSSDLLIHEALHGFDFSGGHVVLEDPRFRAARTSDFDRLDTYERQNGQAGLQETFAESGARFIVEPAEMADEWPALHAYWRAGPGAGERTGTLESAPENGPIGTISMLEDGALALDLRAESDDGAIGHAQFTIAREDAPYDALKRRIKTVDLERIQDTKTPQLFYP